MSIRFRQPIRVLAGLLALAPMLAAQSRANTREFDAAILRPSTETLTVTIEAGGRVIPFATAIQRQEHVTRAGRATWERSYQWFGNDGSRTADTLWVDAVTLAPLENHRHNGAHDATTVFSGSRVQTRLVPKGAAPRLTDTTVAGPLYASGELETLIRAAPLRLGYGGSYALYYGPPGRLIRAAPFRVVGSETITSRAGLPVDCWVVEAPLSEGLNVFYVSKKDRRVIRLVNHEDPNAAFVFTR